MSVSQVAVDSIHNYLNSERLEPVQNGFSIFVTNELSEEMVSVDTFPKSTIYEIKSLFQHNEGYFKKFESIFKFSLLLFEVIFSQS